MQLHEYWPAELWPNEACVSRLLERSRALIAWIDLYESSLAGLALKALPERNDKLIDTLPPFPWTLGQQFYRERAGRLLRRLIRSTDEVLQVFYHMPADDLFHGVRACTGWETGGYLDSDLEELQALVDSLRIKISDTFHILYEINDEGVIDENAFQATKWLIDGSDKEEPFSFHFPLDAVDRLLYLGANVQVSPNDQLQAERLLSMVDTPESLHPKSEILGDDKCENVNIAIARIIAQRRETTNQPYGHCKTQILKPEFILPNLDSFTKKDHKRLRRYGYLDLYQDAKDSDSRTDYYLKYTGRLAAAVEQVSIHLSEISRGGLCSKWCIPIADFPYLDSDAKKRGKDVRSYPDDVYECHPFEKAEEIEADTRTRLREGQNPLWFINEYFRFQERAPEVSFAEFCNHKHPNRIEVSPSVAGASSLNSNPQNWEENGENRQKLDEHVFAVIRSKNLPRVSGKQNRMSAILRAELEKINAPKWYCDEEKKILTRYRRRRTPKRTEAHPKKNGNKI